MCCRSAVSRRSFLAAKRAGVKDVILPAENRMSVEEDLTADQIENVRIHYASRIEDVLAVALPKSVSEEKKDEAVRETIIEHAGV